MKELKALKFRLETETGVVTRGVEHSLKLPVPDFVDEFHLISYLYKNAKLPWAVFHSPQSFYKKFFIDKLTREIVPTFDPAKDLREINAPTRGVRLLQKRLIDMVFSKLPAHPANFAYMQGKSIKDAAEIHKDNALLIKADLHHFFDEHNIHYAVAKLSEITGYPKDLCRFIVGLCQLDGRLPQGALTSPIS